MNRRSALSPDPRLNLGTLLLYLLSGLVCLIAYLQPTLSRAGNLIDKDPGGYEGIPWGSSLAHQDNFTIVDDAGDITGYDRKEGSLRLGQAPVDYVRYMAVGGKFARVTVRYHGKETHDLVMAYLQSQYGQLDRTPGQMVRGLNQQYNWRGTDTEINVTYEAQGDRGYVFFDSRVLSPRFNDNIADNAY
jgi:hypothetical protein